MIVSHKYRLGSLLFAAGLLVAAVPAVQAGVAEGGLGDAAGLGEASAPPGMIQLASWFGGDDAGSQALAEKNRREGAAFLRENGQREGVVTTASGLQYEVLTPAEGPKPQETDTVRVHYVGKFLDGREFDSSRRRNFPATFPLDRVIAGWTEGLQLMSVGSAYRFFIPSDLAYGDRGAAGGRIPPNSALIFDVELLRIE